MIIAKAGTFQVEVQYDGSSNLDRIRGAPLCLDFHPSTADRTLNDTFRINDCLRTGSTWCGTIGFQHQRQHEIAILVGKSDNRLMDIFCEAAGMHVTSVVGQRAPSSLGS
jgi:hypothetical protein